MKQIPENYEPPKTDLPSFKDGTYTVKGFEWFSLDDNKKPMLVVQGGRLVGRLRFTLDDDSEGPPMSLGLGEMSLLILAFEADLSVVGQQPEESNAGGVSSYMEKIAALCNNSGNKTDVEVSSGWVNSLPSAEVKGNLYFSLVNFFPPDENGVPTPRQGQHGSWFGAEFEVIAGNAGQPTPLKGVRFTEIISYAVVVKNGEPDWERTEGGDWKLSAKRMSNLMTHTAPNWIDGDTLNIKNVENFLPEWLALALAEEAVLSGYRGVPEGGGRVKLNWATVERVPYSEPTKQSAPIAPQKTQAQVDQEDEKARGYLVNLMNLLTGESAFADEKELQLSPAGKKAAKTYLTPLKEAGKLPGGVLRSLNFDQVQTIFENISIPDEVKEEFGKLRENLAKLGVGFATEEEEDF